MKQFLKKITSGRDFSVIYLAGARVYGGRFHHRGKSWHLASFVSSDAAAGNGASALREVIRKVGTADYCAITGKMDGMLFFRFNSTEMPVSAQRGAVEFELPRHLLQVPEKHKMQFAADAIVRDDATLGVNVAVYPENAVNTISDLLQKANCAADEFVTPFMAVSDLLDELYLPEVESEFYFTGNMWMPAPSDPAEQRRLQDKAIAMAEAKFILPDTETFPVREFLPLLLTASVLADGAFRRTPAASDILPEKLRPVRFRKHLITTGILVLLLLGNIAWNFYRTHGDEISEYAATSAELKKLKSRTSEMKTSAKRSSKELKEMAKIVETTSGSPDALREFGLISEILPSDVMVSSMRWNDGTIDIVMQCENDRLDVTALIQPLHRWKIAQLQQRQSGDSAVATINLKLAPLDTKTKAKSKKGGK